MTLLTSSNQTMKINRKINKRRRRQEKDISILTQMTQKRNQRVEVGVRAKSLLIGGCKARQVKQVSVQVS